jgi:hypothetical protein
VTRPNPLVDELTPEAKAELAVEFAELKRQFLSEPYIPSGLAVRLVRQRNVWDRL